MTKIMAINIRDPYTAKQQFNTTKYQILKDAAASIMAQANKVTQISLSLIGE